MIIQNFDLNLIPDSAPVVVHCDQYDHGTGRLVISLYDGSLAYSPNGTAVIQGMKPDGRGFDYNCTLGGNVVTADLTEQMTAVAGQVRTQIVVTESTGRTGTFVFILDVQRSALPADTDMSESDYQLIEQAIEDAQEAVEDSSAWAIGERGGIPVSPTDETYNNNAKYWAEQASQYAQGGLHYSGSCLFANIPVSGMTDGDMWNIEDDFVTDSRFREGSGKSVAAGTNIAWIADISKWDVLAVPQTIPDMTLVAKGIGKPDGITTDVSNGTFSAKGVGIVADVNGSGIVHGADWLYYTGTTTVIVPNASQMYRVTISGTASLWYWDGTEYVQLASSGGGSGASLVDVTTAQYNALTPAEKTDPDTWYWINDMDGISGTAIVIGTFAGLTDTNFTNLQDGQIVVYNATTQKWENADIEIPSGDYYELVDGTNIASGTDLNNLTTVGTYTKRAQSFKATNEPSDLTQYERYNLIVQMADNTKTVTTGSPLMQILYAHTRNTGEIKVYTRGYTVPVGWSEWKSISGGASSGVTSFNGRTGAVVPSNGDYSLAGLSDTSVSSVSPIYSHSRFLSRTVVDSWVEYESSFLEVINGLMTVQAGAYNSSIKDLSSYTNDNYDFTGEYYFVNNDNNLAADIIVSVIFNWARNKCKVVAYNPTSSSISVSYHLYLKYYKLV